MKGKKIMKRSIALLVGLVMVFSCISWTPANKVNANTPVTLEQNVGEATDAVVHVKWGTAPEAKWCFYTAGQYATYTFDVPVSGQYKLTHTACINGTAEFSVLVDRAVTNTITITGSSLDTQVVTDAGSYYLAQGTHTIKFTYSSNNVELHMDKVALTQFDDTTVVEQQDDDMDACTAATGGYSNWAADDVAGYIAFWNTQTMTFNDVQIPKDGTYALYVDGGSTADGNSWTASIEEQGVSSTVLNTEAETAIVRTKLGTVKLTAGAKTLTLTANVAASTISMIRVVLIEDKTAIEEEDATVTLEQNVGQATDSAVHAKWGTSPEAKWCFYTAGNYATYTFEVPASGQYKLTHTSCINGTAEFSVLVDRAVTNTFSITGSSFDTQVATDAGSYYLAQGTHTIKFTYSSNNVELHMDKVALVQLDDTTVVEQQYYDKDEISGACSDYSADTLNGYIALWDNQTITFNDVQIPKDGKYGVYVDAGSNADSNSWTVSIAGQSAAKTIPNTGDINTIGRTKLGTVKLTTGAKTLTLSGQVAATTNLSMIRVVLIEDKALTLEQNVGQATDSSVEIKWGTAPDAVWRFYKADEYATYTFEVPVSGQYKLTHTSCIDGTAEFSVLVDRAVTNTFSITGSSLDATSQITTDAGSYYFAEGTHTIKFIYNANEVELHMYKVALTQFDDTTVVEQQYYDRDAISGSCSDYSADTVNGFIALWDNQTITFNDVNIPKDGNFGVYVDTGSNADSNSWTVSIAGQTAAKTIPNTGNIETMGRTKLGTMDLTAGAKTLTLSGQVTATTNLSMIRVVLVWEGEIVEHVLDETKYTCYTFSDAGIADGIDSAYGALVDSNDEQITGSKYDKVLFGGKLTFATHGGRLHYAADTAQIWSGIMIYLDGNTGSLRLEDYSNDANIPKPVLTYDSIEIVPTDFGYETFVNQSFKLQLTTDLVAYDTDEVDDIKLGIWIDGQLVNNQYYYIVNQLDVFKAGINISGDVLAVHYSLWEIEAPSGSMENYIQLTDTKSYLVESDSFINDDDSATYRNGDTVSIPGDYKAIYNEAGDFQTTEKSVVLWKAYDTHADGTYDVRDIVAMKKAVAGNTLPTNAAQKAASELECAADYDTLRLLTIGVSEKEVTPIYYQTDADGKVMPIGGWVTPALWLDFQMDANGNYIENYMPYGVETDFLQEKYYKMIQDLGINLLTYQEKNYAESNEMQILKGLSLAEKFGMNFYVHDSGIEDNETDEVVLAARIKTYSRYSSFAGIHIVDEPNTDTYPEGTAGAKTVSEIAEKAKLLNKYANLIGYVNLFPGSNSDEYRAYVQKYIDTCKPTQLSFDQYPFATGGDVSTYLGALKVIREAAQDNNIPFAGCVGTSTSSYNTDPNTEVNTLTQAQLNWKVNTLLAYGAKGYTWFTLIQPRNFALKGDENGITDMDFDRAGLIGADGSATPVYEKAQLINKWVAKIDSILMDSESVAVLAAGYDAKSSTGYTENYGNITLSVGDSANPGVVAGVFDYNGKTACYIMNYDYENEQTFNLKLKEASSLTIYEQPGALIDEIVKKEVSDVQNREFTLEAGAAVLVVVE